MEREGFLLYSAPSYNLLSDSIVLLSVTLLVLSLLLYLILGLWGQVLEEVGRKVV